MKKQHFRGTSHISPSPHARLFSVFSLPPPTHYPREWKFATKPSALHSSCDFQAARRDRAAKLGLDRWDQGGSERSLFPRHCTHLMSPHVDGAVDHESPAVTGRSCGMWFSISAGAPAASAVDTVGKTPSPGVAVPTAQVHATAAGMPAAPPRRHDGRYAGTGHDRRPPSLPPPREKVAMPLCRRDLEFILTLRLTR